MSSSHHSPALHDALVVAPHPDDETFGCGGTIAIVTTSGTPVDVVYLTRGENGYDLARVATDQEKESLAAIRQQEARKACEVLGVRNVTFLSGIDGGVPECPQLDQELARIIAVGQYQRIFCPWPHDAHRDHQAAYQVVDRAIQATRVRPTLWLYEIWSPMQSANMFVPIDITMDRKRAAMREHHSQVEALPYIDAFEGLASYRALFCPPSRYAEAFLTMETDKQSGLAI